MSETEHYGVLDSGETITPEDIRELTGAVTPHFSLQVRNRVRRLIDPYANDDVAAPAMGAFTGLFVHSASAL